MRQTLFYVLIHLLATVRAEQAASFNVSDEVARTYGCDTKCQQILREKTPIDLDDYGADFDFDFYATSENFSSSKPGDVLKVQALNPTHLKIKAGTAAYRIQYTSVNYNNSLVPVTAFVAFPFLASTGVSNETSGQNIKYPLVAYAHGTSGIYRGCAPSNGPLLYDDDTWQPILSRGYAVIATDYAGLGNNYTRHKYCHFPEHANDIYYSVVAVRAAFENMFTKEWMSVGHSQGGGAVWKLAESKHVSQDTSYLGTVAIAPATSVIDMIYENLSAEARTLPYVVYGVQEVTPGYRESFLPEKTRKYNELADYAQLCLAATGGIMGLISLKDQVSLPGLDHDLPTLRRWQETVAPARGAKSPAPVLVIQGTADQAVIPASTVKAWEAACRAQNVIHLSLYAEMAHSPVLKAAAPEWLGWIQARFSGSSPAGKNCTKKFQTAPTNSLLIKRD